MRTQRGQIHDAQKYLRRKKGSKGKSYPIVGYNTWANRDRRAKNKTRRRNARTMQVQNE